MVDIAGGESGSLDMKGNQKPTGRSKRPEQLGERAQAFRGVEVNDRLQRDCAVPSLIGHWQTKHRCDVKAHCWIAAPCDSDHLGGDIESHHVMVAFGQEAADMTRAATYISKGAVPHHLAHRAQ